MILGNPIGQNSKTVHLKKKFLAEGQKTVICRAISAISQDIGLQLQNKIKIFNNKFWPMAMGQQSKLTMQILARI